MDQAEEEEGQAKLNLEALKPEKVDFGGGRSNYHLRSESTESESLPLRRCCLGQEMLM